MFEILTLTGFELWASGAVNTRSANCLEKCNIGKLVGGGWGSIGRAVTSDTSGQSYKVNYDSRVVLACKLLIFTTLET